MKPSQPTFWLTNMSNRNISLADLNLTIKAYNSINLLDKKHYKYTLEQLQKSAKYGSIFKKRNNLAVRKVAPELIKASIPIIHDAVIPPREKSVFEIKEMYYEELAVSDEEFAEEAAEIEVRK